MLSCTPTHEQIADVIRQVRRFRRYVRELRGLSGPAVHEPWKAVGHLFGGDVASYPAPIVDHAAERDVALERYQQR